MERTHALLGVCSPRRFARISETTESAFPHTRVRFEETIISHFEDRAAVRAVRLPELVHSVRPQPRKSLPCQFEEPFGLF